MPSFPTPPRAEPFAAGADLHNRLALVTGASRGLGFATARALAPCGNVEATPSPTRRDVEREAVA